MIDIDQIRGYFPAAVRDNAAFYKHMLKEYIQLMILDFISSSPFAGKMCFIGGTSLRLVLDETFGTYSKSQRPRFL